MNAKQASLLLPGDVVMHISNHKIIGTVRIVSAKRHELSIDWQPIYGVIWHKFTLLKFVEKWQPEAEVIK